jgi:serine protease Do
MGTGVFVDERGYILTNYHVVEGVGRIQVTLDDEHTVVGRLIAHDPATDLAIVKVSLDNDAQVIKVGTSSDLMLGEPVIAVGNAYGYTHTVTRGIISALHRRVQVTEDQEYGDLIQTDASINPGNSGGPLLNIDGEMIGINVAVRVGAQGIGFAIPADEAMDVAARLLSVERLCKLAHGVVGKSIQDGPRPKFVVGSLQEDGPADRAGLRAGDVIRAVDGRRVERALDFERRLLGRQAGQEVELTVDRNGEPVTLSLVMVEAPRRSSVAEQVWELLGVRLTPIAPEAFRRINGQYSGGLKVVAVRPDGPSDRHGIRRGDVLVGMHKWETASLENIAYILNSAELRQVQPAKFFVLRGDETLYGHMRLFPDDAP